MHTESNKELFEPIIHCPDVDLQERFNSLVGIDEQKERLRRILSLLVNPEGLSTWIKKYHPEANGLLKTVLRRPPLIILSGDVGSGKTELAQTIGDHVARKEKIEIQVFPLSLSTRGEGRVGEMTKLLSSAFDNVISAGKSLKSQQGKARGGIILLIDEADALAQSREAAQMHHEDRAGVNAFIRGIDQISNANIPVAVIMCTNRPNALDPAVKRRAADILKFSRPTDDQRREILSKILSPLAFLEPELIKLVEATGPNNGRIGFTFSDITQRLIPAIVLDAYPDSPILSQRALELVISITPTPQFTEDING
jgi:AAA+ superfamily predicted ATPase